MSKPKFLLIIIAVNLFIHFGLKETLLSEPPIWPDEAFYVNIVKNYSHTGILKLTLIGENFYDMHKKVLNYPPLYFYLIYYWSKLFGLSPTAVRLFSTANSFIVIILISIIYFNLIRRRNDHKDNKISFFSIVPIISLCVDFTFLRSSRILRPEITVLAFVLLSFYYYISFLHEHEKIRQYLFIILAGFSNGVAGMIHFNGFILAIPVFLHFIFHYKSPTKIKTVLLIFYLTSLFSFLIYLVTIHSTDLNIIRRQMMYSITLKASQETFFQTVFYHQTLLLKILYVLYALITVSAIYHAICKKHQESTLVAYYLIVIWIVPLTGKMFWYYVLPVPFIYLALGLYFEKIRHKENKNWMLFASSFLGITNVSILWFGVPLFHYPGLSHMGNGNYSYMTFIKNIQSIIPEGVTVFTSSIPDPYLGLPDKYLWYQFPGAPITTKAYVDTLGSSDYIIFNGNYESRERDNLLFQYTQNNTESVYNIAKPFQYHAEIIKLRPKNQRIWR